MKWTLAHSIELFRKPSQNANGNTTNGAGRLISAEHTGRRVSVTETNGAVKALVDQFDGKKFNSPNDVVVKSDGTIWFTDPPYGLPQGATKDQPGNFVYRFNHANCQTTLWARDLDMPNGLAFSPDEKRLYVADSGKPPHIRVYDATSDDLPSNRKVFCTIDKERSRRHPLRRAGAGVVERGRRGPHFCAGRQTGWQILVPESPANLCFGGPDGKTLFITARKSLYRIPVLVTGPK